MKKILRRSFQVLLIAFIVIQFFRPDKNKSEGIGANDITRKYTIPQDVLNILQSSCYDCHSNNTIYPWYAKVQPVAWWLNGHIKDGKRSLNFSEYASYRIGKQYKRLDDIRNEIKDDGMPLPAYLWIHKYATLNDQQKQTITNWTNALRDTIKANNPPDSLKIKKG